MPDLIYTVRALLTVDEVMHLLITTNHLTSSYDRELKNKLLMILKGSR